LVSIAIRTLVRGRQVIVFEFVRRSGRGRGLGGAIVVAARSQRRSAAGGSIIVFSLAATRWRSSSGEDHTGALNFTSMDRSRWRMMLGIWVALDGTARALA